MKQKSRLECLGFRVIFQVDEYGLLVWDRPDFDHNYLAITDLKGNLLRTVWVSDGYFLNIRDHIPWIERILRICPDIIMEPSVLYDSVYPFDTSEEEKSTPCLTIFLDGGV